MNQTIYFRKDVWDKFKDEAGKSNLVNQLLATHYSLNPREVTVDDRPLQPTRQWSEVKSMSQYVPPQPKHPPELRHEPRPGLPNRYYHTEWNEYVQWTEKDGIT